VLKDFDDLLREDSKNICEKNDEKQSYSTKHTYQKTRGL